MELKSHDSNKMSVEINDLKFNEKILGRPAGLCNSTLYDLVTDLNSESNPAPYIIYVYSPQCYYCQRGAPAFELAISSRRNPKEKIDKNYDTYLSHFYRYNVRPYPIPKSYAFEKEVPVQDFRILYDTLKQKLKRSDASVELVWGPVFDILDALNKKYVEGTTGLFKQANFTLPTKNFNDLRQYFNGSSGIQSYLNFYLDESTKPPKRIVYPMSDARFGIVRTQVEASTKDNATNPVLIGTVVDPVQTEAYKGIVGFLSLFPPYDIDNQKSMNDYIREAHENFQNLVLGTPIQHYPMIVGISKQGRVVEYEGRVSEDSLYVLYQALENT
jgi:hypothetical protein